MKKTILYLLLALFISCSPLDRKCGTDLETIVTDLKILVESGEITNEEFSILSDKILGSENISQIAGKKTYREILKKAKLVGLLKDQREERELKEMNEILDVSLSKNINIHYNNATFSYPLVIINKSKNNIRGFKGTLIIKDLLDTKIETVKIEIDDLIKNSTEVDIKFLVFKSRNVDDDRYIRKFKTEWIPEKILFSDDVSMKKGNIDILDITLSSKNLRGFNQGGWTWSLEFKNNSQRIISAFKGNIIIKDLFDKKIASFPFRIDDQIEPSSTIREWFPTGIYYGGQVNDEIENKNIKNLKIEWNIDKLIFLDELQ